MFSIFKKVFVTLNMRKNYFIVITTTESEEKAKEMVKLVLSRHLASCAHIFNVESHYWWKGKQENSNEYRIEFKTNASCLDELKSVIKNVHNYEVPELVVIPIIDGLKEYLNWITEETR